MPENFGRCTRCAAVTTLCQFLRGVAVLCALPNAFYSLSLYLTMNRQNSIRCFLAAFKLISVIGYQEGIFVDLNENQNHQLSLRANLWPHAWNLAVILRPRPQTVTFHQRH